VLEDLDVQGLIQSGTKRRRLRLYDSSFSELRAVLEWEFRKREKQVLPVPAYNSSRECFLCGRINENLKESLTVHIAVLLLTATSTLVLKRGGSHRGSLESSARYLLRFGKEARR